LKILIVNYRYFISGGPERYLFNIKELLEKNGHTVVPFSVKSNFNIKSKYEKYFLSEVGTGNEIYAEEYSKRDIKTVLKVISRLIYSIEAKRQIARIVKKEKPDVAYILHYQNKISCSIIDALYDLKIPIVHRISDFGHICANNIFYLYSSNEICERCLAGSKFNAIRNKCVKNSYLYSAIRVFSLKFQEIHKIHSKINYFIFPAIFTLEKYLQYGIPANKCVHIPTYFNFDRVDTDDIEYEDYFLYIGRIEIEKGLMTLIKSFVDSEIKLKIVGFSSSGYEDILKEYLMDKNHNIEFLGKLQFDEIRYYLKKCLFTVLPSECNDNMPNTLLESFAYKKAVLASDVQSLKEFIIDEKTGVFFKKGNYLDLREKVNYLVKNKDECVIMGNNAYQMLNSRYSENKHYKALMNVFHRTIDDNR
jgi:glycosyltransferase involved in cell wall biosynthesis